MGNWCSAQQPDTNVLMYVNDSDERDNEYHHTPDDHINDSHINSDEGYLSSDGIDNHHSVDNHHSMNRSIGDCLSDDIFPDEFSQDESSTNKYKDRKYVDRNYNYKDRNYSYDRKYKYDEDDDNEYREYTLEQQRERAADEMLEGLRAWWARACRGYRVLSLRDGRLQPADFYISEDKKMFSVHYCHTLTSETFRFIDTQFLSRNEGNSVHLLPHSHKCAASRACVLVASGMTFVFVFEDEETAGDFFEYFRLTKKAISH
eukprot:GHVR01141179.1.p1 GENE.GHVR01141179.1~~GHVR01141179.1.p1  ORF type:complete len:284 (+),score=62.19 GHVR01141179.1:73-852(+)